MKHWVFDLDGTLVDSFPPYFQILGEILGKHGKSFAVADRLAALSVEAAHFLKSRIGEEHVPEGMKLLQRRNREVAESIKPYPEMVEVLRHLVEKGRSVSIWTNRDFESAEEILKKTGLAQYSSILMTPTQLKNPKPHPEGLFKIADFHKTSPSEMIMVGDHEMDVVGGKTGGAKAVRASWHGYWEFESCKIADHQFYSADDFRQWALKQIS